MTNFIKQKKKDNQLIRNLQCLSVLDTYYILKIKKINNKKQPESLLMELNICTIQLVLFQILWCHLPRIRCNIISWFYFRYCGAIYPGLDVI